MPAFWQSLTRDLHAPIRSFNAAKDVRNCAMLAGPASHHPALCSDGDPLERVAKQQTQVNPNFLAVDCCRFHRHLVKVEDETGGVV